MAKTEQKKDPRKGDDRNLVLVDQDFGQPDLEDRIWLFWVRNKVAILSVATLAVAGSLGFIIWLWISSVRLDSLQSEYTAAANTPEGKLAFAKDNAGQPLAGVAALEASDQLFKDKKFAEADAAYSLAKTNFDTADKVGSAFAGRALLGSAFSKLHADKRDEAVATFTEIANTPAYPESIRGEALHTLAVLAVEKNQIADARKWLDLMDRSLSPQNIWVLLKGRLISQVPALVGATETPAATPPAPAPAAPAAPATPATPEVPAAAPAAPVSSTSAPAPTPAAPAEKPAN